MKTFLSSLTVFFLLATGLRAVDIHVAAAASLTDALKEIGTAYTAATGDRPVCNVGASSTLARQIEEGAPVDVCFSADEAKMDALQAKNLIVANSRRALLNNSLVVVVLKDSPLKIDAPAALATGAIKRLAIGEPQTVPAGIYAREFLTRVSLWEKVQPKTLPCDNVRAALAWNPEIAQLSRRHNDSNILVLPSRFMSNDDAEQSLRTWLETPFEGGRHERRVEKIDRETE